MAGRYSIRSKEVWKRRAPSRIEAPTAPRIEPVCHPQERAAEVRRDLACNDSVEDVASQAEYTLQELTLVPERNSNGRSAMARTHSMQDNVLLGTQRHSTGDLANSVRC